jgi:4-amino-4-deoxy-L-arabinose transferase-like glycosyltransferase
MKENRTCSLLLSMLALLAFATALYVRIRLLGTPLERDEGEYAYVAQLLLKGIPPYTYAYTMKLPGIALVYALFMSIFGQSAAGIHIGLLLVNTACTGLVYLLGRRLFTHDTALIAAAFYALLSLSQSVMGIFAHATHLVVLFSLAGMILLDRALKRTQPPLILLAGICFGMAFLMKQHAAVLIPFALAFQIWPSDKGNRKLFLRDCTIFLTGAAAPYIIVALWLFKAGVFARFWFWTVQYAREYATGLSLTAGFNEFVQQFTPIIKGNLPIWLLAAAGLFAHCGRSGSSVEKLFLSGYLTASIVMVSQGLYFRPHYFVLLLPPIAILAAYATQSAKRLLSGFSGSLLPPLIVATATLFFIYSESDYLFRLSPVEVSRRIYSTNPFPEAIRIAKYIKEHTSAQDKVAILGSEPEMLFYSDRLSATGHIYMYGLMEGHRYAGEMQARVIEEIEQAAPLFIVVVHNSASWLLRSDSVNRILDWGDCYIPLRYDEVGIVEIFGDKPTRYFWDKDAVGHDPEAESFVSIYRRRW